MDKIDVERSKDSLVTDVEQKPDVADKIKTEDEFEKIL